LPDGRFKLGGGGLLAGQVVLHHLVVELAGDLHQLPASGVDRLDHFLGNGRGHHLHALGGLVEGQRLTGHQIDHPLEAVFAADGQLEQQGPAAQAAGHHLQAADMVGAGAVHLVDEGHARNLVAVGLTPDRLRLGLHPAHRAENGDDAVQHAQGALDLDGEVNVTGGIDDVQAGVVPEAGGGGGGYGYAALLFLLHPVHDGRAVMHLSQPVRDTGVEENAFGCCGLAGVNMGHEADIAMPNKRYCARHVANPDCPFKP
jgi:hypothetical protein